MKKNAIVIFCILIGLATAFVVNYFLLEKIIISNPCYYHNKKTTQLFNLFYSIEASNGGHPFPTGLNIVATLLIGGYSGFLFGGFLLKNKKMNKVRPTPINVS